MKRFCTCIPKGLTALILSAILLLFTSSHGLPADPPRIVATPPADADRGLVRVSKNEIRHYSGKGGTQFLRSIDNGESWNSIDLPPEFPAATCISKESPSIVRNPMTGEFLRVEPLYRGRGNSRDGQSLLTPGKVHTRGLSWTEQGAASVAIDGIETGIKLPLLQRRPNGLSYLHISNPAAATDLDGFSVFSTHAKSR